MDSQGYMTLDDVVDDATARRWFREQWRHPEFVAEQLDDFQFTACAAVLRWPELAKTCTAHLFASPDGFYLAVFRAVQRCPTDPVSVLSARRGREWVQAWAEWLDALGGAFLTVWRGTDAVAKLKKIIAWQYRQEKKRKAITCTA